MTHSENNLTRPQRWLARIPPLRRGFAAVALFLILFAWWQIWVAGSGLVIRTLRWNDVPVHYLAPQNSQDRPGVIVAHGYAASKQVMLGYGYTLARAGYAVLLPDFSGHGANGRSLTSDRTDLGDDLDTAYRALLAQPEVDPDQVALLGHSMGSGVVMRAGLENTARYRATIAVSPTDAAVTAVAPRNFLLLAGQLEPPFIDNAEILLTKAGGSSDDFSGGVARDLEIIPNVEHIGILFSPVSHQAALDWLNRTFGEQTTSGYQDGRILWYGLHLLGWLILLIAVSPLWQRREVYSLSVAQQARPAPVPMATKLRPWHWLGLLPAPFMATGTLYVLKQRIEITQLGGVQLAGTLGLWFLLTGLTWLILGFWPARPGWRDVGTAVPIFGFLWVAFGLMAHFVWLPWFLIPERLWRWPLLALALLPWLLAAGFAQQDAGKIKRFFWWLAQSLFFVVALLLATQLMPSLFFLLILVPLLPVIMLLLTVVNAAVDRPWAYAIGGALFFSWLLLAVFPLA